VLYRETHTLLDELAEVTLDGTRKEQMEFPVTVPLLIVDDLGMRKLRQSRFQKADSRSARTRRIGTIYWHTLERHLSADTRGTMFSSRMWNRSLPSSGRAKSAFRRPKKVKAVKGEMGARWWKTETGTCTFEAAIFVFCLTRGFMEGLFQPMHLLLLFVVLLFVGVPFLLVCRWLWRKSSH
jgi:hypothetical protein